MTSFGDANISACKNDEEWYMRKEDDTGEDRTKWFCPTCPLEADCSTNAWKNAKAWSWETPEQVQKYVKQHLIVSAKHYCKVEQAQELAILCTVEYEEQSFEDREQERKEEADRKVAKREWERDRPQQRRRARARGPPRAPPRGGAATPRGRRGAGRAIGAPAGVVRSSPAAEETATEKLTTAVEGLTQIMKTVRPPAGASSSSAGASSSTVLAGIPSIATDVVEVPLHTMRLLHAGIRKAREAAEQIAMLQPVFSSAETAIEREIRVAEARAFN